MNKTIETQNIKKSDITIIGTDLRNKKKEFDALIYSLKKERKTVTFTLFAIIAIGCLLVATNIISDKFDLIHFSEFLKNYHWDITYCILVLIGFFGIMLLAVRTVSKQEIESEEYEYNEFKNQINGLLSGTAIVDEISLGLYFDRYDRIFDNKYATAHICYLNDDNEFEEEHIKLSLKFSKSKSSANKPLFEINFDKDELIYYPNDNCPISNSIFKCYKINENNDD